MEVINHMTTKQTSIAAVVKNGVQRMKDKITALKAIRGQHVNKKNAIELQIKKHMSGSVLQKRTQSIGTSEHNN